MYLTDLVALGLDSVEADLGGIAERASLHDHGCRAHV